MIKSFLFVLLGSLLVFVEISAWAEVSALVSQCRVDLCGKDGLTGSEEIDLYVKAHQQELHEKTKNLAATARAAFTAAARSERRYLGWILEAVETDLIISDPYVRGIYNKFRSIADLSEIPAREDGSLDQRVIESKLIKKGISSQEIKERIQLLNEILSIYNTMPLALRDDFAYWSQKLNAAEVEHETMAVIDVVEKRRKDISDRFGVEPKILFSDELLWQKVKKQLGAGKLEANLFKKLQDFGRMAIWIDDLVINAPKEVLERVSPLRIRDKVSAEMEVRIRSELKELDEYLDGQPKPGNKLKDREDRIAHYCVYTAVQYDRYYPDSNQVKTLGNQEKTWRDQFLGLLKGRVPESVLPLAQKYFAGLLLKPPVTKDQALVDMLEDLNDEKSSEESDLSIFSETAKNLSLVSELTELEFPDSTNDVGSEIKRICTDNDSFASPLKDHTMPSTQRVHLGALSATEPDKNRFVAFHEYSHILSYLLTKGDSVGSEGGKWRQSTRQCLIGFHDGSDQFEEEDFADLLAYDMSQGERSVFCRNLPKDEDSWLTLKSADEDRHSNDFTRILHGAAVNGSLPESCVQALKAKGEAIPVQRCLVK